MAQQKVDTTWMVEGKECWVDLEKEYNENQAKTTKEKSSDLIFKKGIIQKLILEKQKAIIFYDKDQTTSEELLSDLRECNQDPKKCYEDMVDMEILNEPEILQNIKKYFQEDQIFTKIGPTLIVMNPYKYIPELFQDLVFEQIRQESQQKNYDFSNTMPHVWSIAANSYTQLFEQQKNQAIVISGESGAGKTENTKYAMKFLTSLSENKNLFIINEKVDEEPSIEEKILRCNPILEAFGNAKTVRNDNSSRFGKYVRIWIHGQTKKIQGASINKYLLEKTRVTHVAQGERNYHIFYHFMKGNQELSKYDMVNDASQYKFLDSDCVNVAGVKDLDLYEQVISSFKTLGFTSEEQNAIFRILAGILHIGNIEFDSKNFSDQNPCDIANKDILTKAAQQLQVSELDLQKAITLKTRTIGKSVIESPIDQNNCEIMKDTIAKALYDKVFDWLVVKLNQGIEPEQQSDENLSLGLLDIFGFENFEINSFEQVCINFTNEKLQQLYIEYVFKSEKKEFINEGLEDQLTALEYKDNQDVIDLISLKRLGIFELLDESCSLANNTDSGLLAKIQSTHDKNPCLKKEKLKSQNQFTIIHTAKQVVYDIEGFRLKNKDEVVQSIKTTIEGTQNQNIAKIWKHADEEENENEGPKRKGKSDKYLGAKFRQQMDGLMTELQSCGVHFIRCLKPNESKQRGFFHQPYVMQQIKYLGVLESVKVRKEGFPFRLQYSQFYEKYHEIHSKKYLGKPLKIYNNNQDQIKQACQEIITFIFQDYKQNTKDTILFGTNKIYMRFENSQYIGESLKAWHKKKEGLLVKIQRQGKQYNYRKTIFKNLKQVIILKKRFIKIQATFKRNKQRRKYLQQINYTKAVDLLQITQQKFLKKALQKYQDQVQCLKLGQEKQQQYLKQQEEKRKLEEEQKKLKLKQEQEEKLLQQQQQKEQQKSQTLQNTEQQQQPQQQSQQQVQQQQLQQNQEQKQNQEVKNTNNQSKYSQNKHYNQQDIFQDEFAQDINNNQQQLPIWLDNMPKRDIENDMRNKSESKLSQYMTQSTMNKSMALEKLPTYLQTSEAYKSLEDTLEPKDFEDSFIKKVETNNFLTFCQNYIVKGANFSKSAKIEKMMSFSKDTLKEPLTKCPDFAKEADLIWRSILKIGGNRRSRFPLTFHQSNAISISLGQDTLDGQEEQNIYISQIDRKAQQQSNYGMHLAQKYNSNVLVPSDRGNFNGYQVILKLMNQILGDKTLPLRNELYFQICKQLEGNSSDGIKKLYKFCSLCLNIFSPGSDVMLPLLNFFYVKVQKEKHQENKKQANYIFNKLALLYQSYLLIREMPFIITEDLLISCKILKKDPIQNYLNSQTYKKVIPFELMEYHISNLSSRCILPIKEEINLINERQSMVIGIHLFSQLQDQLKINCSSSKTVFQIRNEVMSKLGMEDISQCYGLYEVKTVQDQIQQEGFLSEGDKIMDILASQKNEEYYYFQKLNKLLVCKIYLKIKFQYPFTSIDQDTVQMQYTQAIYDLQNKQIYNMTTVDSVNVAAHVLYVKFGNSKKEAQNYLQNNIKLLVPDLQNRNIMNSQQWQQRIITQYQQFKYESITEAQFNCLNIFRKFDEFLSHNFEGRVFEIQQQGEGYVKSNQPKPCVISIKPMYVIIQKKSQNQIDNKYNNIVQIAQDNDSKQILPISEIQSWGKSVGKTSQYFYIKSKSQQLYIFALKDLNSPDYILNIYKNYPFDKDTQKKSACKYFDILSFLMNKIPNQQDQVEENDD